MFQIKLAVSLFILASLGAMVNAKKMVNCYYGTWAKYRTGNGNFEAENIDPFLCTHISYSFFGIDGPSGRFKSLDTWLDMDTGLGMIRKTMQLKSKNPNLKILAVVGGWNEGSDKFSAMAADPHKRKAFIDSSLAFIKQYGFDGLDIDWEYPAQREGSSPRDKQNFVTLLKELKNALSPLNLELGIAVGASATTAAISYDIPNIAKYVDFINVMTYDFHNQATLSYNSPLKGQGENNVESAIKYWLNAGAPASKLIMGLAFYGRHFAYAQQPQAGAPQLGEGTPGPYTQQRGFLGYNEICQLKNSGYNFQFDNAHGVPYAYNGNQWIGFDDAKSIAMKVQLANSLNLGGAMVWSLESDDFRGECGEKYVLLNALNSALGGSSSSNPNPPQTVTTRKPSVVVTSAPVVSKPNAPAGCSSDGYFANQSDCNRFYQCSGGVRYEYNCAAGLHFDTVSLSCTWPGQANCGMIRKTMQLKSKNPNLKILAVVGGWNEGSDKFSAMAADPHKRKAFIDSSLAFIKQYGFDGLDIDWEYPAQREGSSPRDKQNFVTLLKELKNALSPLNLELGIAVGASATTAAISYDIPNIAKYVDFINVMTYDFHNQATLSYNSPLKGQGENNVESAIKYWLNAGAPASKLIMGLAFYGRHFAYAQQPQAGAPQLGEGTPGPYTQQRGFLGYNEICQLKNSGYNFQFDNAHGVPYAYNGNQWIGFDDAKSIAMKVQLANSLNLGGAMVWSLESDDFRGECGEKYVLLNALNSALGGSSSSNPNPPQTVTTRKPSVVVTSAPVVSKPNAPAGCSSDGYFANQSDCNRFYQCSGGVRYEYNCAAGLHFDTVSLSCTWPGQANCGN